MNPKSINSLTNFQSSLQTDFESDFSCLSREELIVRLEITAKELMADLTIAAEIGQHLLEANQSLRHAYDELLHSDMDRNHDTKSPYTSRISSAQNTPTKLQFRTHSHLSPSPKKAQSFNMTDYVESLERRIHDLSHEVDVLTKKLSQSNRNNQKLNRDLEVCAQEIDGLKQLIASSSIKVAHKEQTLDLKTAYEQLDMEHHNVMERSMDQEKELERVMKAFHQLEMRENALKNELKEALESKERVIDSEKVGQKVVHSETQTSKATSKSTMSQTIDKSLEKESLSFFKSIAFINSKESQSTEFKPDQLFIPCRFPTSPQGINRSKTTNRDEWMMEMPDDFTFSPNIPQSQKPKPAPILPKNERLQLLMSQFVNYVYDLIL